MQQNLNFGLNWSVSSITFSFADADTELISSSGEGFELIETRISIGTDFRIDAEKLEIWEDIRWCAWLLIGYLLRYF